MPGRLDSGPPGHTLDTLDLNCQQMQKNQTVTKKSSNSDKNAKIVLKFTQIITTDTIITKNALVSLWLNYHCENTVKEQIR